MKVIICQPGKDHGVTLYEDVDDAKAAKLIRGIPRKAFTGKGETKMIPVWIFEVYDDQGLIVSPMGREDWGYV